MNLVFDFAPQDLFVVGFLVLLEGVLSVDNAIVLAMLCRHLPEGQRKKALTYGLWGAIGFRGLALAFIVQLIQFSWVKFVGGGYLLYVAAKEIIGSRGKDAAQAVAKPRSFWGTVFMVELMDIAFAVDSILAAAALSGKLWVLFLGGVIGIVLMRLAASIFIRLLEKYPAFETSAFILVGLVGLKLVIEGFHIPGVNFHDASGPAFWVFWLSMVGTVVYGFKRQVSH